MSYAKIRVLIVDDMGLARERLRRDLLKLGFETNLCKDAVNGREALEMLKAAASAHEPFQMVLSDWNMPEMTGVELLRACRADEALRALKFMIVSSEGESNSVVEAIKSGANDYGIKPIAFEELTTKIKKMIG